MPKIDLVGQRYGRLLVISNAGRDARGKHRWLCKCDCGSLKETMGYNLQRGSTKSCGCYRRESPPNYTHGKSQTVEYRAWVMMNSRCYDVNCPPYPRYGGRGIHVCQRWRVSFENFYQFRKEAIIHTKLIFSKARCDVGVSLWVHIWVHTECD